MHTPWRQQLAGLYRQHGRGLLAVAASVTGSRSQAEDAVHEAFARLCKQPAAPFQAPIAADGAPRLAADRDRVAAAYVYRAVRNAAIDLRRRQRTRDQARQHAADAAPDSLFDRPDDVRDAPFGPTASADPAALAEHREQREQLMDAIDALADAEQQVVVMRAFGGLTLDEVADATGEPRTTVSSRYHRALKKLRTRIGQPA